MPESEILRKFVADGDVIGVCVSGGLDRSIFFFPPNEGDLIPPPPRNSLFGGGGRFFLVAWGVVFPPNSWREFLGIQIYSKQTNMKHESDFRGKISKGWRKRIDKEFFIHFFELCVVFFLMIFCTSHSEAYLHPRSLF